MPDPTVTPVPDPTLSPVPGTLAPLDAPRRRPRVRRRVTTAPPPGSDPAPLPEPERHRLDENDERLKAEKPPHY